jgi:hypothetical protein
MDDQAEKLRQLVRTVRHAATVATGPPLVMIYTIANARLTSEFTQSFIAMCQTRGITLSSALASVDTPDRCDWQIVERTGDYDVNDHEFWQRASVLVVLTDADDESIVDSYKALKHIAQHMPLPPLELVVRSDQNLDEAHTASDRLLQTCRRFLRCSIAGATLGVSTDEWAATVAPLVDRLVMMAPVAPGELYSPLAVQVDEWL